MIIKKREGDLLSIGRLRPHDPHAHDDHSHCNHHKLDRKSATLRKLVQATALNVLLSVVMFVGAYASSSVSLAADAVHNLSDALALVIAYAALKWSMKPADQEYTYGYGAAESLGTFANSLFLMGIAIALVFEAFERVLNPVEVQFKVAMIVAAVALVVDLWTVWLLWRDQQSQNLRAAMVHNLSDAMASVVVLISGALGQTLGWWRIDSFATLLIAGYIFYHTWPLLKSSAKHLMRASPPNARQQNLETELKIDFPTVHDIHHIHMWQITEVDWAFECHISVNIESVEQLMALKQEVKRWLAGKGFSHSTLEFEHVLEDCGEKTHQSY